MKRNARTWGKKAFTLIELLIVVAIIAILAAIAVPNFLEAQTRSKVSRVEADMRSVATAIEAYTVDWNGPPGGWREYNLAPFNQYSGGLTLERYIANKKALCVLTTPVAFMTSIPNDPFQEKYIKRYDQGYDPESGPHPFNYDAYGMPFSSGDFAVAGTIGYKWALSSPGPGLVDGNTARILVGTAVPTAGAGGERAVSSYDPSNGTISRGIIMRTNKGIYEGDGSLN